LACSRTQEIGVGISPQFQSSLMLGAALICFAAEGVAVREARRRRNFHPAARALRRILFGGS